MKRRRPAYRVRLNPNGVWKSMHRLNISQNEVARLSDITSGYLSQLMTGKRCPSAEVRRRLMRVLRVTLFDDLFIMEKVR